MARPRKVADLDKVRQEQEEVDPGLLDRTIVFNKDPNAVYRFVRRDGVSARIARSRGYVPVERKEGGEEAPLMDDGLPDGLIGSRELVLMKADRTRHDARREAQVRENTGRLRKEKERYVEEALKEGRMTEAQANVALKENEYERQ